MKAQIEAERAGCNALGHDGEEDGEARPNKEENEVMVCPALTPHLADELEKESEAAEPEKKEDQDEDGESEDE